MRCFSSLHPINTTRRSWNHRCLTNGRRGRGEQHVEGLIGPRRSLKDIHSMYLVGAARAFSFGFCAQRSNSRFNGYQELSLSTRSFTTGMWCQSVTCPSNKTSFDHKDETLSRRRVVMFDSFQESEWPVPSNPVVYRHITKPLRSKEMIP
jgi:hypothetical protein